MADLGLLPNEGIVIQYNDVYHNNKNSEIFLTNLNLICVECNSGFFKTTYNVLKYPVNQIKVVNGQAQASVIKDNDEWTLQVLFKNSTEKFRFSGEFYERLKKKQVAEQWAGEISKLLTGHSAPQSTPSSFFAGAKNALGAIGIKMGSKAPENVTVKCMGCMAPISGQKGQTIKCKYCDTDQTL